MADIRNPDPMAVTVLIVEDEALIRMVAVDVFTESGFEVLEAGGAQEAIDLLHSTDGQAHVVFTDIHMPGEMNGLALAHFVSRHWPSIGLLMVSGHPEPPPPERPEGCRFFSKPYDINHIVAEVRELAQAA